MQHIAERQRSEGGQAGKRLRWALCLMGVGHVLITV